MVREHVYTVVRSHGIMDGAAIIKHRPAMRRPHEYCQYAQLPLAVCFSLLAEIPNLFQQKDAVTANPRFLVETEPREVFVVTGALAEDVEAGFAEAEGQSIRRPQRTPPTGIFFEHVVHSDPSDPNSQRVGTGRFNAEVWVLSWFGLDFSGCTKAQLEAIRFGFDALVPFVLLFLLSYVTPRVSKRRLEAFYAKIHTAVQPTPERDSAAIELATQQPNMHDSEKLLPDALGVCIMRSRGLSALFHCAGAFRFPDTESR